MTHAKKNLGRFFLHESSSKVQVRLHTKNQLPRKSGSGVKICTDFLVFMVFIDQNRQYSLPSLGLSLAWVWQLPKNSNSFNFTSEIFFLSRKLIFGGSGPNFSSLLWPALGRGNLDQP